MEGENRKHMKETLLLQVVNLLQAHSSLLPPSLFWPMDRAKKKPAQELTLSPLELQGLHLECVSSHSASLQSGRGFRRKWVEVPGGST